MHWSQIIEVICVQRPQPFVIKTRAMGARSYGQGGVFAPPGILEFTLDKLDCKREYLALGIIGRADVKIFRAFGAIFMSCTKFSPRCAEKSVSFLIHAYLWATPNEFISAPPGKFFCGRPCKRELM